jgi:uncharacterized protein Smg (DUF494 family)
MGIASKSKVEKLLLFHKNECSKLPAVVGGFCFFALIEILSKSL